MGDLASLVGDWLTRKIIETPTQETRAVSERPSRDAGERAGLLLAGGNGAEQACGAGSASWPSERFSAASPRCTAAPRAQPAKTSRAAAADTVRAAATHTPRPAFHADSNGRRHARLGHSEADRVRRRPKIGAAGTVLLFR